MFRPARVSAHAWIASASPGTRGLGGLLLFATLTLGLAGSARATVKTWNNTSGGTWSTPTNWTPTGAPGAGDTANINTAGTYVVTLDASPTITRLNLGAGSGSQTLQATSRTLTLTGSSSINFITGKLVLVGSTLTGAGSIGLKGSITVRDTCVINTPITTGGGASIVVEGNSTNLSAMLTVGTDLTLGSGSHLDLTSVGAFDASLTVSGTLATTGTGTVNALPGGGGNRLVIALLDNQGTFNAAAPLQFVLSSGSSSNSGTFNVSANSSVSAILLAGATLTNTGILRSQPPLGFNVSGGTFHWGADPTGGGILQFTNASVVLDVAAANDSAFVEFTNCTISGLSTLTSRPGKAIDLNGGCTRNDGATAVQGTFQCVGNNTINGALTVATGGLLFVNDTGVGALNVAGGLVNNGKVELTSLSGGQDASLVFGGRLTNPAAGLIQIDLGTGGKRLLQAPFTNQGTINAAAPFTLKSIGAVSDSNSGVINVITGSLTADLSNIGTLVNTGTFRVATACSVFAQSYIWGADPRGGGLFKFHTSSVNSSGAAVNDSCDVTFFGGTIAPVSLTASSGHTMTFDACQENAPLGIIGTVVCKDSVQLNGALSSNAASTLRIEGGPSRATLNVLSGFGNNGNLDLTSSGSAADARLLCGGTVTNFLGSHMRSLPGTGGNRFVLAAISNGGTLQVDAPLTLSKAGAAHASIPGGVINLGTGDLTVVQDGSGIFTDSSIVSLGFGRTLTVRGGLFRWRHNFSGGGTLALRACNVTLDTTATLTGYAVVWDSCVVSGTGPIVNQGPSTLSVEQTTVNPSVSNSGLMIAHGTSSLVAGAALNAGSTLRVEGTSGFGDSRLTVPASVTDNGAIELTSAGAAARAELDLSIGTLVAATGGVVRALAGSGGARTLGAELDIHGLLSASTKLAISRPGAHHVLRAGGLLQVSGGGNVTVIQSGASPSLQLAGSTALSTFADSLVVMGGQMDLANSPGGNRGLLWCRSVHITGSDAVTDDSVTVTMDSCRVDAAAVLNKPIGFMNVDACTLSAATPCTVQGDVVAFRGSVFNDSVLVDSSGTLLALAFDVGGTDTLRFNQGLTIRGNAQIYSRPLNPVDVVVRGGPMLVDTGGRAFLGIVATPEIVCVDGQVVNRGLWEVDDTTAILGTAFDHSNAGLFHLVGGSLSMDSHTFSNTGTLTLDSSQTFSYLSGTFTNQATGVIDGKGTLFVAPGATFQNSGTISPGTSPGVLGISGNATLAGDGALDLEVFGANPGTGYDRLDISGNATLAGTLNVSTRGCTFYPAPGDSFRVMSWGSHSGTFTNLSGLSLGAGLAFTPLYRSDGLTLLVGGTSTNHAPAAQNDAYPLGTTPVVLHLLSNDVDSDGDSLRIAGLIAMGTQGTVTVDAGDTTVTYTPPASANADAFSYIVKDCHGGLDTAQVVLGSASAVNPEGAGLPKAFALTGGAPNPFRAGIRLGYALPAAAHVRLAIFDVTGRELCRVVDAEKPAGWHDARWDGRDGAGRSVASGVYLARLEVVRAAATPLFRFAKLMRIE